MSRHDQGAAQLGPAAAPLFAALGDETRLRLLTRLASGGPESITHLTTTSQVSRQAITKHFEILMDAGLVKSHRRGRERIWELEPERLAAAHEYLDSVAREWDNVLDRLKQFMEGEEER